MISSSHPQLSIKWIDATQLGLHGDMDKQWKNFTLGLYRGNILIDEMLMLSNALGTLILV